MVEDEFVCGTDEELIDKYMPLIDGLTRKCPRFWRQDAIQQLKMEVLLCERIHDGQLLDQTVRKRLKQSFRRLDQLERNRGITYCPDLIDWDEVQHRARECGYTVTQSGNHTIYEKSL